MRYGIDVDNRNGDRFIYLHRFCADAGGYLRGSSRYSGWFGSRTAGIGYGIGFLAGDASYMPLAMYSDGRTDYRLQRHVRRSGSDYD